MTTTDRPFRLVDVGNRRRRGGADEKREYWQVIVVHRV